MREIRLYLKRTINTGNYDSASVEFGGVEDQKDGETLQDSQKRMMAEIGPVFDELCEEITAKFDHTKMPSQLVPKEFSFGVPRKKD